MQLGFKLTYKFNFFISSKNIKIFNTLAKNKIYKN